MCYKVTPLKEGIIRISIKNHEDMPENHFQRYGILNIPNVEGIDGFNVEDGKITLPNGRAPEFFTRHEYGRDDEFRKSEIDYQNKHFIDNIPISRIEGRPDEVLPPDYELMRGDDYGKSFGISFKIADDEKFYGLGEGGHDRVQLRDASYQNWAIYHFDEIVIPLVYSNKNWGLFINAEGRHFVDIDDNKRAHLPFWAISMSLISFCFMVTA